jgi:HEAT repeat protein
MAAGLTTTFQLLGETDNEAAAPLLVTALDASQRQIRDQALTALLNRRNSSAELNVLRRWNDMSMRWKTQVAERLGWLSGAIRKAVLNRDARLYECGCAAAVFTRDYDLIPVLVSAATDPANPQAQLATAAVLELAELLAEELATPRDYRIRRDPQLQRNHVLPSLEQAATGLDEHGRRELLEAFLLLANRENAVLKRQLQSPTDRNFLPLADLLANSSRQGIERLLLSYLDDPHAPLSAIQVVGRRSDVSFLRHLVRKIGAEPSPTVRLNVKRIESIPWFNGKLSLLDALCEAEQPGAVHLAVSSSVPRPQAYEVVAYVLRHGKVAGRRIAAKALAEFKTAKANELAVHMLEDDDAQVRAAIAAQLRERGVPGAINRLIQLLDSPHQAEREAAQASLEEFKFERFSANFDDMSAEARATAGPLVRRIDAQAVVRVQTELEAQARSRRKRGLEMAVALDAVALLQDAIIARVKDEDQYLRIEAIRVLATIDSQRARQVIRDALLDPLPLVQEAAEAALAQLTRGDTVAAAPAAAARDTVAMAAGRSSSPAPAADARPPTLTESWSPKRTAALSP